jgi:Holliday junction DNA helicase RuvA
MIGFLRGTISQVLEGAVLLDVSGVGYEVQMPASELAALEEADGEVLLHTHLVFKEDGVNLYGFAKRFTLDIFRMLLDVSGVGPKLAMNILSAIPAGDLVQTLAAADAARLKSVHGVGKKTAERICVDLRERARRLLKARIEDLDLKIPAGGTPAFQKDGLKDALEGLMALGYRPQEARRAAESAAAELPADAGADRIIKRALQLLSRI